MPGHTTLWGPEQYIKTLLALAVSYRKTGLNMTADECEGAARLMWKLWKVVEPEQAAAAVSRLFKQEDNVEDEVKNKLVLPSDFGTGERMMQWLSYEHLPTELQMIVKSYNTLGLIICNEIPGGPERTVALRKLVESKDCAVRAIIEAKERN